MKTKYIRLCTLAMSAIGMATLVSCNDVLDEQPRSIYEPGFFKTESGIDGGLTALYAHLRNIYGNGYYLNICETGTDEYTYGQSADGNFKDADLSGAGSLTASSSRSDVLWNNVFTYINTASGIIENATAASMDESKISEARFFRAFDFFQLVRTFGGVPLDFGSGILAFNATPSRTSVRNTVPEVYTKAIFPDLLTAVENLPDEPRTTGAVTKTVARKYLAEAYLTYAWWLENPKNIPTYPECDRTDPDGHNAAWYFQQAYDVAVTALENPGPYGLEETFYDVTRYTNDRNKEILLYADHTTENSQYNGMTESGGSWSYASGSAPDNFAGWMANWNYGSAQIKAEDGTYINPVQREAIQNLGRPWIRMAPTIDAIKNFGDKSKDSRYDATFTTVYHGNWHIDGSHENIQYVFGNNNEHILQGEVVIRFLDEDPATPVTYSTKARQHLQVGVGTLAGYKEYVVEPEGISRLRFPGLYKLGMYPMETLSSDGKRQLGSANGSNGRPFNIAKFSELYLIAAEAAVKGATVKSGYSAKELVNVLRARAGKWTHKVNSDKEYCEDIADMDYSAELVAETPNEITIDYILDERMREFFGEGYRWFDLTRTQTWQEKAGEYRICGQKPNNLDAETITRTIPDGYYLRPIPQATIDAFEMTEEERVAYQNPAYR